MLLAALLDAGADERAVRDGLRRLGVAGLELRLERVERHSVGAARVEVLAPHEHAHRRLADVLALLDAAALPARAAERARRTFELLAAAEGRVHRVAPEQVTFHEVGALDAVADVCGVALALEALEVERVVCSPLPLARGFVRAAHGRLPLPAPAVLELLRGAPVTSLDVGVELVTPTGAALVAALAEGFGPFPPLRLGASGYGAGSRDLEAIPNLVRVVLGEPLEAPAPAPLGEVVLLEANLDDLLPELVPDAAEACLAAGALDAWTTAVGMKKGRPGVTLSVLARPHDEARLAETLLRETSTLGVRVGRLRRHELEREHRTVLVDGEPVRVKLGLLAGEVVNVAPEHDDCAALARRAGRPVKEIWAAALGAAQEEHGGHRGA
jgi:uncharacterized protein (TIGR00299 family) protein